MLDQARRPIPRVGPNPNSPARGSFCFVLVEALKRKLTSSLDFPKPSPTREPFSVTCPNELGLKELAIGWEIGTQLAN